MQTMGHILSTLFGTKPAPCECGCDKLKDELRDALGEMRRERRSIELEWENTYNKLRSLIARLNKRAERVRDEETPEEPVEAYEGLGAVAVPRGGARANHHAPMPVRRNY